MTKTVFAATTLRTGKWKCYLAYKDSGAGWLGEIPAHWEVKRLKYIAHLRYGDSLPNDVRTEGETIVFGSNGPVGFHSEPNTLEPVIIIGRKGSFGKVNYSEQSCFAIDTTYFIDIKGSKANLRWLFFALQILKLDTISQDSAIPGLSRELADQQWLPEVPISEQCAIASFLDRETTKINTLIAKKERLIELLQEKRTALISHAVTKGLDPKVPIKDSGVEWLGEIPAHWQISQLRRVVKTFVDYRGFTPIKTTHGVLLITARNIKNGVLDFTNSQEFISEEDYASRMVRGFPEIGDVLITTEAPLGEVAQIADERVTLAQRIILLKIDKLSMTNEYLKYYFMSSFGQGELWSHATGSTAIGIKASHLREVLVVVPSLIEQFAIITFLDHETANIDALISRIREGIEKLKEYSSALISAAVTGKIDVSAVVAASENTAFLD